MSLQKQLEFEFKKLNDDVIIHTTLGEVRELVQDSKRDVSVWAESWFDNKRKSNEMWKLNQDELSEAFLEDLLTNINIGDKHRK